MKAAACWCGRPAAITHFPASRDGQSVATLIQCPAHLDGQVSMYGSNFGAVHRAVILAWNDYQETMASVAGRAA